MANNNTCSCGSNLIPEWQYDARGIPLCKACPKCVGVKLGGYRQDVLLDPGYYADEPIEADY